MGITNGDPKNLFFKCVYIVILVYLWFQICKVLQLLIKVGYLFLASHLAYTLCMDGWTLVLTFSPAHLFYCAENASSMMILIIAAVVVLVLILGAAVGFADYKKKKSE